LAPFLVDTHQVFSPCTPKSQDHKKKNLHNFAPHTCSNVVAPSSVCRRIFPHFPPSLISKKKKPQQHNPSILSRFPFCSFPFDKSTRLPQNRRQQKKLLRFFKRVVAVFWNSSWGDGGTQCRRRGAASPLLSHIHISLRRAFLLRSPFPLCRLKEETVFFFVHLSSAISSYSPRHMEETLSL
jgi:hypothetical protein